MIHDRETDFENNENINNNNNNRPWLIESEYY